MQYLLKQSLQTFHKPCRRLQHVLLSSNVALLLSCVSDSFSFTHFDQNVTVNPKLVKLMPFIRKHSYVVTPLVVTMTHMSSHELQFCYSNLFYPNTKIIYHNETANSSKAGQPYVYPPPPPKFQLDPLAPRSRVSALRLTSAY